MSKQLNIPVAAHPEIDVKLIASNLKRELDQISQNLASLKGRKIVFSREDSEFKPYGGWDVQTPNIDVRHITSYSKICIVAGVDSSCIPIAETAEGAIYAARAAAVFSSKKRLLSYLRLGPILTYIDEGAASKISQRLSGSDRLSHAMLLDRAVAQRAIRVMLERALTAELAKVLSNSVILIDGSLKPSRFESSDSSLRRVLKAADEAGNSVIGLSKTTRIWLLSRLSHALYTSRSLPAYIDVDQLVTPLFRGVEGRILLVRFAEDGHPFRVDVYPNGEVETPLSLTFSNDAFYHGYPETLRLAHHLSVFTLAQREYVRSHLAKSLGAVCVPSEDVRYAALGGLGFKRRV